MKNEIISKLFSSKWNYAWGRVDEYLISLFYKHDGFSGLHEYVLSQKEKMNKTFEEFYSADLPDLLHKAKTELQDSDFEDYIFRSSSFTVSFNKQNFKKLKEYKLLKYYYDFGGTFRGYIIAFHKIGTYEIIETNKKAEIQFYNVGNFSYCYNSLENALLNQIFKGRFSDALTSLLEIANKDK